MIFRSFIKKKKGTFSPHCTTILLRILFLLTYLSVFWANNNHKLLQYIYIYIWWGKNSNSISDSYLCKASELWQMVMVAPYNIIFYRFFFKISPVTIMGWLVCTRFLQLKRFLILVDLQFIHWQLFYLISCYVGIMLFRIEKRYCNELKFYPEQHHFETGNEHRMLFM